MMQAATHRVEARWGEPGGRAPQVRLFAPASPPIAAMLRGRTPDAALGLIPLIFNLCAGAQEGAARCALGAPRAPDMGRRIAAETLREHALRCLKDWPEALGLKPDLPALIGVGRLEADDDGSRLDALEAAMFGEHAGALDLHAFAERGAGPAAKALRVVGDWPAAWAFDAAAPSARMDPTLLRRVADDPRLTPLLAAQGATLFARMAARIVDAARMIEILRGERPAPEPERLAPGIGVAEAARGKLIHRARIDAGRIADYAVETPTDAVMEEGGMLSRMIAAAGAAPPPLRDKIARLAILACDPCAPVSLSTQTANGRNDA
ncbi:MAG: hypothetical protein AAGM38_04035 [Pseudomonadota bacterium]